jgi:hypothetical protein
MLTTAPARQAAALLALGLAAMPAAAQQAADIGFVSVGRAAPLQHDINRYELVGASTSRDGQFTGTARAGETPAGVKPLERDLFTSPDFYADRASWSDPRYFRCNSPLAIESIWGGNAPSSMGDGPASAPWGHCERDYPRESIVSPYPFRSAQEHYEALLAETRKRGGPRVQTQQTLPDEWNGIYRQPRFTPGNEYWFTMRHVQVPTVLSLLTPDYQTRVVQETYHHGHTNKPMWPSQFCWPEGFLRRSARDGHAACRADSHERRDELRHQRLRRARVQDGRPRAALGRERAALVWRDHRLLGRGHADHVDFERSSVGNALSVRAFEQDAVDRDLHAAA